MHMADALLSPPVGATLWGAAVAGIAWSAHRLRQEADEARVPLMGVLGAFVFAAQMINFALPGTGSSGHLGGGLLLAILIGPHAAFLTLASVLAVQALFFADGGLLALGSNLINLGFFPCYVAYPLIYRPLAGPRAGTGRRLLATVVAAVAALQLGALGVVLETTASGISELPFTGFVLWMLPIHLAIGLVEGLATALVVDAVYRARPELARTAGPDGVTGRGLRNLALGLGLAAALTGGLLSWLASSHPDGLEWAIGRVTGGELTAPQAGVHGTLARVQEQTVLMPDYALAGEAASASGESAAPEAAEESWPAVQAETSLAGLLGGLLTLGCALLAGLVLRRRNRQAQAR